jgi:hypothetical protein
VFASDPEVIKVGGEENASLWTSLLICGDCFMYKPLDMPVLLEKMNERQKQNAEEDGA